MKLKEKTLDKMMDSSKLSVEQMILLDCKFWISKNYTEFPEKHYFFDIIQSPLLDEDTIMFSSEKSFLNKFL
jgi:hypothetical protein